MKYQLIRAYDDCSSATECADSIVNLLAAAAIYLEDTSCVKVEIVDRENNKTIMDYWRD